MFKSAAILFLEQFLKKGVLFVATLVMAYFLSPSDFGLIAIAVFIMGFSNSFVESGLKDAVIRAKETTQETLSTAYWINNFFAIVVYLFILSVSPYIAEFYGRDVLKNVLPIIALTTILFSQQVVPLGVIHKHMEFSKVVKATLPAAFISSAISIFLAYAGHGIWALVIQILLSTSITSYILFRESGFRPTFDINTDEAKDLLGFGVPLFLSNIVSTISKNLLFLISGKLLGLTVGGFIYMADKIMETIMSQIVYSVQQASYPVMAKNSDNPKELYSRYRDILSITSAGVSTILGLVFISAASATQIFFSEEWFGLEVYIMSLSIAYCLYPIHSLNMNILKVMGKTKLYLYLDMYKLAQGALVITITAGISVHALLVGIIFLSVVNLIPNIYYTNKLIGYSFIEQIKDYLFSSTIPIIASAFVYLTTFKLIQPGVPALALSIIAYLTFVAIGFHLTSNRLLMVVLAAIKK